MGAWAIFAVCVGDFDKIMGDFQMRATNKSEKPL